MYYEKEASLRLILLQLRKRRYAVEKESLDFESDTSTGLGQAPGVEANKRINNRI